MKTKILLIINIILLTSYTSYGKEDYIKSDEQVNSILIKKMNNIYSNREIEINKSFKSAKSFETYRNNIILKYKELFELIPLNINEFIPECENSGILNLQKFSINKIILNNRITANIYKPKTKGKHPAVLIFCGHEIEGKATKSYQKMAQLLVLNNFVVMMADPISQGERKQMLNKDSTSTVNKTTTEHTLLNMTATLVNWSMAEEELIDNIISMNYLCKMPEVDSTKIGCIGNSGGGAQATYFSAYDNRIKAVACCSWYTKRQNMMALYGPDDGCQYIPKEIGLGLEINDYYLMKSPRPTLILSGTKDFIDYKGAQESFKELKSAYTLLGHEKDAIFFSYNDGHGLSKPKREVATKFFMNYLKNDTTNYIKENDSIKTFSLQELQCSKSGNIIIENIKNVPIMTQRMKQMSDYYIIKRKDFLSNSIQINRHNIRSLLGMNNKHTSAKIKKIKRIKTKANIQIEYTIKNNDEIKNQAIVIFPKDKIKKLIVIALNNKGAINNQMNEIDSLIKEGAIIIKFDPCGIGNTSDNITKNNNKFYSKDYRNSALMLMLGKTMIGEQTEDIIDAIDLAKKINKNDSIIILSYGDIGIAARHAYYLDNRIEGIKTIGGVETWREILNHPTEKDRMDLIVPKALLWYDINYLKR